MKKSTNAQTLGKTAAPAAQQSSGSLFAFGKEAADKYGKKISCADGRASEIDDSTYLVK